MYQWKGMVHLITRENDNQLPEQSRLYKLQQEEKLYNPETHNQSMLRIKELAAIEMDEKKEMKQNLEFVNLKKELFLKANGMAHIIFDIHKLQNYTIAIANLNEDCLFGSLLISPDNGMYTTIIEKRKISHNKLEIMDCRKRLKYLKLELKGKAGDKAVVYLQGEK